ncbi:caspase-2-like isoform X2 [Amblyomma americanum]
MDSSDPSEQEVSEEMHYSRLKSLVQKAMGTSNGINRLGLDLMDDCWFYYYFNKSRFTHMPFECEVPQSGDNLVQVMHCHLRKAPCCDCWEKRSICNLGISVTPEEIWDRWIDLYKMRRWPRGLCIIIGNIVFNGLAEEREGCLEDVKRMRGLFMALHFNCVVATNLKAAEMKKLLKWAAEQCDDSTDDCLVAVLMSHGEENCIYGADYEPLHLYYDVYEQFNNDNCPQLKGKPKLFFVQACRGENYSCGTTAVPKNSDSGSLSANPCNAPQASKIPERRDTWTRRQRTFLRQAESDRCGMQYGKQPG